MFRSKKKEIKQYIETHPNGNLTEVLKAYQYGKFRKKLVPIDVYVRMDGDKHAPIAVELGILENPEFEVHVLENQIVRVIVPEEYRQGLSAEGTLEEYQQAFDHAERIPCEPVCFTSEEDVVSYIQQIFKEYGELSREQEEKKPLTRKEKIRFGLLTLVGIFGVLVIIFLTGALIWTIRDRILKCSEIYFYQEHPIFGNMIFCMGMFFSAAVVYPVFRRWQQQKNIVLKEMFIGRHWKAVLVVVIAFLYLSTVNIAWADEDGITICTTFHPGAVTTPYDQVEAAEVGYCSKNTDHSLIWYGHDKGDFYYKVKIDGKWFTFDQLTTAEESELEQGSTLLLFDQALMEAGVEKTVNEESLEYAKYCRYNDEIQAEYQQIINNR